MGERIGSFNERFREDRGPLLDGVLVQHPTVAMVERLADHSGLGFLLFDLQHGAASSATVESCLAVAHHCDIPVLARLGGPESGQLTRVLDAGASGVILPMVEDATLVTEIGRDLRFPPDGHRSYSSTSRTLGGWPPPVPLLIGMIESRRGVDNANQIANVAAVDGLYIGPADLALSLSGGRSPEPGADAENAVDAVIEVARICGVAVGMHRPDPETARQCRFRTVAGDLELLSHGLRAVLGETP